MIKLFAGLGNPGPQYEQSRHNAGFWWIDQVAGQLGVKLTPRPAFQGLVTQARTGGQSIWLLKPQTFMNESGRSVAALARFYRISPEEILVIHDEMDLPAGQAKLKHGGGHAGHNGLRDIHAQLGSADYWRLRLGIGHPQGKRDTIGWVLGRPAPAELELIGQALERSTALLQQLASGDMERATQTLHSANPERGSSGA